MLDFVVCSTHHHCLCPTPPSKLTVDVFCSPCAPPIFWPYRGLLTRAARLACQEGYTPFVSFFYYDEVEAPVLLLYDQLGYVPLFFL